MGDAKDIVYGLLSPIDPKDAAIIYAVLGISFHLCIRKVEIDNQFWSLLAIYIAVWMQLTGAYLGIYHLPVLQAIKMSSLCGCSFMTGLTASISVYRLFFHRLRRFPGPWAAKLSRFYNARLAYKSLQYNRELEKLHKKYGDFVRTGPREISIIRPSAVQAFFGFQSECRKSTWYSQVTADQKKTNLATIRDHDYHRLRRKPWDRAFGPKALEKYDSTIQSRIDLLLEQMRSRQGSPVNITDWMLYLTYDVMGKIAFGKSFNQLEDAAEHDAIRTMHGQMRTMAFFSAVPWLLAVIGSLGSLAGSYGAFIEYCDKMVKEKEKIWKSNTTKTPEDVFSYFLKGIEENDPCAPATRSALNQDARLVIVAASDTTGGTLANVMFYLASNQAAYRRLQDELDEAFPEGEQSFSYNKAKYLPYLDAVITETLRLKPAIPSGQPRVTPPEGVQVDEVWIPGDTVGIVPPWIIQRDERNFVRALEFLPERWLPEHKEQLIKDPRAYFPFQLGPYACVGKSLANQQMKSAVARLALSFDICLAPGEDGVAFDNGAIDAVTFQFPPLQVVFKERNKAAPESAA